MADAPHKKEIGQDLTVEVEPDGYPNWVRLVIGKEQASLRYEEAHDLLYAMQRICRFLDFKESNYGQ